MSPATDAVAIALARRGLMKVAELATKLDLSARQIERVFRERVGLSPEAVSPHRALPGSARQPARGRARPAVGRGRRTHGFYDQAHFIRDFKAFVGESPGAWNITPESLAAVFSGLEEQTGLLIQKSLPRA